MDNWNDFYEICEITVDIECEDLPEEIERALLASNCPPMDIEPQPPARPRQIPKPQRQLRLTLKSPELRKRFNRVVETVPGRGKEAQHIFSFITKAQNGSSSPLCLHGNTGCGKTSLITKVMQFFEQNSGTVSTAYLNCMSIRTVNLIYVYILERFYGGRKQARGGRAADALQRCLMQGMGRNEPTKIVVLDEIDHVIGQSNFLYNMFQWLVTGAKIVLVLISNVIDLAVQLDSKLQSRIKFDTLIFQPYKSPQIEAIILHKYPNIRELCKQEAIRFVAKKIYNINSDIRTLDKIYNRIHAAWVQRGRMLDLDIVNRLIQDDIQVPPMPKPYALVASILNLAEKGIDLTSTILQRLYIECQLPLKKEDVFYLLCDLQDEGLLTLMTRPKNPDATFYEYGIKVHESLRLYVESSGK